MNGTTLDRPQGVPATEDAEAAGGFLHLSAMRADVASAADRGSTGAGTTTTPVDRTTLPSTEERTMLRDSLRGWLASRWPPAGAVERAADRGAMAALWRGLAEQGLAALGSRAEEGGARELVVAMEELGRAAAPAPLLGAALLNLAWRGDAPGAQVASLLDRLHTGTARIAWSFGELDPDPRAASIALQDDGTLAGTLRFVEGADSASDLVIAARDGLFVVALGNAGAARGGAGVAAADADMAFGEVCVARPDTASGNAGVAVQPSRALGTEGWCQVTLARAAAAFVPLDPQRLTDLRRLAPLLLLARAHGAARRAFEMVVDYAKERRQFGQPIGRFQAIQHKLADGLIALEGVRLTLEHAAESCDFGLAEAAYEVDAAIAFGGPALREVALQTQHVFGAIGYAEEHEAPRHFRRVHLDTLVLGGVRRARAALAAHLLDRDDGRLPEDDLGAAGNAFRAEVREWLATHWDADRKAAHAERPFHKREFDAAFARDLGRTGWLGLGWPRAFGGQERTPLEQLAFLEMMERAEAPPRFGAGVQANALIMHGTPAQQARFLPEILRGEVMHGMGYSEPNAGSDLAALRTTAVRDGDAWVIDGQKIWTTTYWGEYMFLAARTDRDAQPPQAGISMFIVPMATPGITVKPAATMYDGHFANIYYDGVRIPAENIVGPVHGGWKVLTDALANERGMVGGGIVLKVAQGFDRLCEALRAEPALRADALVRDRIGQLAAEIEVGRRLMIHCAELAAGGTTPPALGAISKVWSGELMERYGEAALELLGPAAALSQGAPSALANGRFEQQLRHSLMWVISIGTNEIQRSLIAQRGLGLPR